MSDKDKLQAIKNEIERRITNLEQLGDRRYIEKHFTEQFRFIETYEGLIKFIDSLPEEPASEDLEEATSKYVREDFHERSRADFKAGAEWQKQQMMKDAVECVVSKKYNGDLYYNPIYTPKEMIFGERVKLIIIKEEQQ